MRQKIKVILIILIVLSVTFIVLASDTLKQDKLNSKIKIECVKNKTINNLELDKIQEIKVDCPATYNNNGTKCYEYEYIYKDVVSIICKEEVKKADFNNKQIRIDNTELYDCDDEKCCSILDLDSCCYMDNKGCYGHRNKKLKEIIK